MDCTRRVKIYMFCFKFVTKVFIRLWSLLNLNCTKTLFPYQPFCLFFLWEQTGSNGDKPGKGRSRLNFYGGLLDPSLSLEPPTLSISSGLFLTSEMAHLE